MKKFILFIIFVFAFQISYKIIPISAQEDEDTQKVKMVVETFLKYLAYRDIDSAMQHISINYLEGEGENIIDYARFKSSVVNRINTFFKNHTDYSISEPQLNNLNIKDSKATVEVEFNWKGFNLDTLKEEGGKAQRSVILVKEDGSWKITQWRFLQRTE